MSFDLSKTIRRTVKPHEVLKRRGNRSRVSAALGSCLVEPGQERVQHQERLTVCGLKQNIEEAPGLLSQYRIRVGWIGDRKEVGDGGAQGSRQPIDEVDAGSGTAALQPTDVGDGDMGYAGESRLRHPTRVAQFPQPGGEPSDDLSVIDDGFSLRHTLPRM